MSKVARSCRDGRNVLRVVLTRETGQNDALRAWIPSEASVVEIPLTTTSYADRDVVAQSIREASTQPFTTLVVTSARSAPYAALALNSLHPPVQVVSVGEATTSALLAEGVTVAVTSQGGALDLATSIVDGRVLLLGAHQQREELPRLLAERGIEVVKIVCYETRPLALTNDQITEVRGADVLLIGAPSAWEVVKDFVDDATWVAVPGHTTSVEVRKVHQRVIEGWGPSLRARLEVIQSRPR